VKAEDVWVASARLYEVYRMWAKGDRGVHAGV